MYRFDSSQPSYSAVGRSEVERLGSHPLIAQVESVSPDIARLLVDVALGEVLERPDLDATRELLALATLAALGADADFVAVHSRAALSAGASAAERLEGIMQVQRKIPLPVLRSARAVVVAFFDALAAGDVGLAVGMAASDALWSIPGDPLLLPWVGEHHGQDAIRRFYSVLNEETETESLALGPVIAHGELVLVRGEFAYRFPRTDGRYAGAFVIVFTVRDGLIERYEMHEDTLGLARAFWNAS